MNNLSQRYLNNPLKNKKDSKKLEKFSNFSFSIKLLQQKRKNTIMVGKLLTRTKKSIKIAEKIQNIPTFRQNNFQQEDIQHTSRAQAQKIRLYQQFRYQRQLLSQKRRERERQRQRLRQISRQQYRRQLLSLIEYFIQIQRISRLISSGCPRQNNQNFEWFFSHNSHLKYCEVQKDLLQKFEECSICYLPFSESLEDQTQTLQNENQVTELYCHHIFHTSCIKKWLKDNPKCPMCRSDFRDHEDYKQWDENYKIMIKQQKECSRGYRIFLISLNTYLFLIE